MPGRALNDLTIAVAHGGDPADPAAYSGTPNAMLRALTRLGVRAVPLGGAPGARTGRLADQLLIGGRLRPADVKDLRAAIDRARPQALAGRAKTRLVERVLARRLATAGALDGIIQYGAEVRIGGDVPLVTLEDATYPLARSTWDWVHLRDASEEDVAWYTARAAAAYRRARGTAAMNLATADSHVRDFGRPPSTVHVVGVGANHRPMLRHERDWNVPRFLFVGFDWERKNGPRVLRAFETLRAESPRAELHLVGGHPPIVSPGVTGHGVLRLQDERERERLAALFGVATGFVMPSLYEPAGAVHAEALQAGIGSIGTTRGGPGGIVGDAGLLVDPEDDAAILAAMRRFAQPAEAATFAARAAARAPLFTWEVVVQRLIRALRPRGIDPAALPAFLPWQPPTDGA